MAKTMFVVRVFAAILTAVAVSLSFPAPSADRAGGTLYEALLRVRGRAPVAPELLVVDTGSSAESLDVRDWAELLLLLLEKEAERALFLLEAEPRRHDDALSAERLHTIKERFDQEFSLVDGNIASLFEAILLGSIRPGDTARFVEELRALVRASKLRLLAHLLDGEDSGELMLERARRAFGYDRIGAEPADIGIVTPEHPEALVRLVPPGRLGGDIPFRKLELSEAVRYLELGRRLHELISEMDRSGYTAQIDPENRPTIIHDHALALRAELLARPSAAVAAAWRESRERYVRMVGDFVSIKTELELIAGFERLKESETFDEAATAHIDALAERAVDSFAEARETFRAYSALRRTLREALRGAVVIVGPGPETDPAGENPRREPTETELRAGAVSAVLTGAHVLVPTGRRRHVWTLAAAALIAVLLAPLRPLTAAVAGPATVLFSLAASPLLFLRAGTWVDPWFVVAVTGAGAASSVFIAVLSRRRVLDALQGTVRNRLPSTVMKRLAARGRLPSGTTAVARSVILAVQDAGEPAQTEAAPTTEATRDSRARAMRGFHKTVSAEIRDHGGVVLGAEGFTVFAGFGTPVEPGRLLRRRGADPERHVRSAFAAAHALAASDSQTGRNRRYGLDTGECSFICSSVSGYIAAGSPVGRAKMLCSLAARYDCRIAASQDIVTAAGDDWEVRKLALLVGKDRGEKSVFYELIGRRRR